MASDSALKSFLARTPFFGGLEDGALDRLIGMAREKRFARGELVFEQGDEGRSMYVVRSGELVALQSGESGFPVRLRRFAPGDFFGETTLIEMQPRPFAVKVEEDAVLYELTNMDLYALYKQDVKAYVLVLQNINRELCRRLRSSDRRVAEYAEKAGEETTQIGLRPPRGQ